MTVKKPVRMTEVQRSSNLTSLEFFDDLPFERSRRRMRRETPQPVAEGPLQEGESYNAGPKDAQWPDAIPSFLRTTTSGADEIVIEDGEVEKIEPRDKEEIPEDKDKGKGKENDEEAEIFYDVESGDSEDKAESAEEHRVEDEDVSWMKYDPPTELTTAPNISSDIILEIVQSSIDKVKTEVAEELERRKRQEEEAQQRREREAAEKSKDAEPYLPIIIVEDVPKPEEAPAESPVETGNVRDKGKGKAVDLSPTSGAGLVVFPIRPQKKHRSAIARLFKKLERSDPDRGESSSAAAVRSKFRQIGHYRSISASDLPTDLPAENSTLTPDSVKFTDTREKPASIFKNLQRPKTPEQDVECVSCLDDFKPKEVIRVQCHHYCTDCFTRLIASATQNEQHWPPKCCLNEIPFRTIRKHIDGDLRQRFDERAQEWSVPISDRLYCHQPDCSLWLKPDQVNAGLRIARCTAGHWSCTICRGAQHQGEDCPQDKDMNLTNELAEEEGWKHCYSCHALVEHREACQHMTCRCGAEFCYVCSARWRTCACTMEQLAAIKNAAQARREARIEKERQEEEDLRDILRQIEEYEREEALKAVLLRQEQERQEKERRRQEVEARIRAEAVRQEEVKVKYDELRVMLADLHRLQRLLVGHTHDEQTSALVSDNASAREDLAAKQESERTERSRLVNERVANKQLEFDTELAMRISGEKQLEDEYHAQLAAFFAAKPGGEAKIEARMTDYRRKMDQGFRMWTAHRDEAMQALRSKIEDEGVMREELMYSVRMRLEDVLDEKEEELKRRKDAEKKWVKRVVGEREVLLERKFMEELENGDVIPEEELRLLEDDESGVEELDADLEEEVFGIAL